MNEVNLDTMTAEQIRAFRGDQYQDRENAQAAVERANYNIRMANGKLAQLETPKADESADTPADQPDSATGEAESEKTE